MSKSCRMGAASLFFFLSHMGHAYFGVHTSRAAPQTLIPKHTGGLGMPGDSSSASISWRGGAACAQGGVPGLGNRFPRLLCPNLTPRNSSLLREKEADRPTDGCRRKGGGRTLIAFCPETRRANIEQVTGALRCRISSPHLVPPSPSLLELSSPPGLG